MDPFVAEVRIFPFNFAPRGWAFCDGQILPLSQNTALFSLLGTTYGGDGRSNFALPNLRGSTIMHSGQGPGLSLRDLGETGGSETVTLLSNEIPNHTHTAKAGTTAALLNSPANNALTRPASGFAYDSVGGGSMAPLSPSGGNQPHNNMQPYLTLNFCIAMQGVFPPRS